MPDLDTQLTDYADWLADRAGPVSAEEATTSPAPAVTLEPDDHEVATARRRRTRLVAAVAAVAAVLVLGVLMATLLPTSDQDDVETAAVAPGTDLRTGWERISVDWEGGRPIDVASNGDGILRAVVATPIRCPSQTWCGPDLDVWESSDDGRSWHRQGSLAAGGPSLDGSGENYRSPTAIAGNGPNWIVTGNRSDQPVAWLPTSGGAWVEVDLPGRPAQPRSALIKGDGSTIVVGNLEGEAAVWLSIDERETWTVSPLPSETPTPDGPTAGIALAATSLIQLEDGVAALGIGANEQPTMWTSASGTGWVEERIHTGIPVGGRAATDGVTIWAVEAYGPLPDGRVTLWTRRDGSWQETETPVPWSVDAPPPGETVTISLQDQAPALAATDLGVVLTSHDGDGDSQALWASPDGVTWSPTDASMPTGTTNIALTAHRDGFVAVSPNHVWVWQPR
jgi:hypothetical protein